MLLIKQMEVNLDVVGRHEPNAAFDWLSKIERRKVSQLRKRKIYFVPVFIDAVRTFISIQTSSASAGRLFGDAGYHESTCLQHGNSAVTEMLLMIRGYVR